MSSVDAAGEDDRTARARIRDAAIARFAADGPGGASVRAIATEAGVSPALVLHHFGSKDALRRACDEHVTTVLRARKHEAMRATAPTDPLALLRDAGDTAPLLLRYLARALGERTEAAAHLFAELVDDAEAYLAQGVREGVLRPSGHPRERATLLVTWQLAPLLLHEQLREVLGLDLLADEEALVRWSAPAVEVLTHGLFADDRYEQAYREAVARLDGPAGAPDAPRQEAP